MHFFNQKDIERISKAFIQQSSSLPTINNIIKELSIFLLQEALEKYGLRWFASFLYDLVYSIIYYFIESLNPEGARAPEFSTELDELTKRIMGELGYFGL